MNCDGCGYAGSLAAELRQYDSLAGMKLMVFKKTRLAVMALLAVWRTLWRTVSRTLLPRVLASAVVVIAVSPATARAAEALLPVRDFFSADAMSQPVLSPSGNHLAVRIGGANGRYQLAVISLMPPRQVKVIAGFADADVANVSWVNDERLIFAINDLQLSYTEGRRGDLFAIDRTGEQQKRLNRDPLNGGSLMRVLRDGSSDVIMRRQHWDARYRELLSVSPVRMNTITGRISSIDTGLAQPADAWAIDDTGQARAAESRKDGQYTEHWNAKPGAPWEVLATGTVFTRETSGFSLKSFGPNGQMYVLANTGKDGATTALYRFDPVTRKREPEPLVAVQGFDFEGFPIFDGKTKELIGVRYTSDATATVWFDDGMKALQADVDKRRPGMVNLINLAECGCSRWALVTSHSDRQAAQFLLYDLETKQLEPVGAARPALDARRMATRDFERIKTRDGLSMPIHVTKPAGTGPWPTVVLVHGGPYLRGGQWGWDANSQFLASRGYLVVEPEFRGSTGYGNAWFRAGLKQWGLAMQDDVADATRWAVAQGLADPKRVCIAGASYGGYATLMGLVRDPDLYRCGLAWVGVTDINLMYDLAWSDFSEVYKQYGMPVLIGDQIKDAAQLDATSPLKQAARITQPLLLAYGGADRRVPVQHGVRFRDAVRKTNAQVEWQEYPDEGHGWYKPENRYDFWSRVETFLAKQLAP
jgi:dipeptidyl aminopeptidase/acylaminoacyl peptidase